MLSGRDRIHRENACIFTLLSPQHVGKQQISSLEIALLLIFLPFITDCTIFTFSPCHIHLHFLFHQHPAYQMLSISLQFSINC